MSEKSKRYDDLAAGLRAYKAKLTAIGISGETTSELDGYASQVESFAAELNEPEPVQVDDADLPSGKLAPSGPISPAAPVTPDTQVPDAQTQLDIQKSADAAKVTATGTREPVKTEPAKP